MRSQSWNCDKNDKISIQHIQNTKSLTLNTCKPVRSLHASPTGSNSSDHLRTCLRRSPRRKQQTIATGSCPVGHVSGIWCRATINLNVHQLFLCGNGLHPEWFPLTLKIGMYTYVYSLNIHCITFIIYTIYLWNTPTYHSLHINVVNLSIIHRQIASNPKDCNQPRESRKPRGAWHIISPYSNLPLETLPTHQENHGKPFSYRHQNCNLPTR